MLYHVCVIVCVFVCVVEAPGHGSRDRDSDSYGLDPASSSSRTVTEPLAGA
jgi:hypothetical protein